MRFGPFEIMILLAIFFLLFGEPSTANTEADLDAGGKTKAVDVAQKAEEAGIDPSGMTTEEVEEKLSEKED